jgi:hypothetical protein
MKRATLHLIVAASLFAGWILYLAYLAVTAGTQPISRNGPIVLSRPQLLISNYVIVAQLDEADDAADPSQVSTIEIDSPKQNDGQKQTIRVRVTLDQVIWPERQDGQQRAIRVTSPSACQGWAGPGRYILPLIKTGGEENTYELAPVPRSPGIEQHFPRIYPATEQTRTQLDEVLKEKPRGAPPS